MLQDLVPGNLRKLHLAETVDDTLTASSIYVPGTEVPLGAINCVLISDSPYDDAQAIQLSNGSLALGSLYLKYTFTLSFWIKYASGNHVIVKGSNNFSVELNTTGVITLLRQIASGKIEVVELGYPSQINTWQYVSIVRNYNVVTVYKNLVKVSEYTSYYYPIVVGNYSIGDNVSYKLASYRLSPYVSSVQSLVKNIDSYRSPLTAPDAALTRIGYKVVDLRESDLLNNSYVYPTSRSSTFYDMYKKAWIVTRASISTNMLSTTAGLAVQLNPLVQLTTPYTLNIVFGLSSTTTNAVIASQWDTPSNRNWYLYYDRITNSIRLVIFNKVTAETTTVTVGAYTTEPYYFSIVSLAAETRYYINGSLLHTTSFPIDKATLLKFNYDTDISATGNVVYLYSYSVYTVDLYAGKSRLPTLPIEKIRTISEQTVCYNYKHPTFNKLEGRRKVINALSLSSASTLTYGQPLTLTLALDRPSVTNTVVTLKIDVAVDDALNKASINIPATVNIPANTISSTFSISLSSYSYTPYVKGFTVSAFTLDSISSKYIQIADNRSLSLTAITGISGYVDGYFSNMGTSTSIPNLTSSATATSTVSRIASLYGNAYLLTNPSEKITFPTRTVKTAFLVYKELVPTTNRGYFGDSNSYTFNGGLNYQLTGGVVSAPDDYAQPFNSSDKVFLTKLSDNGNTLVAISESPNKVKVYRKLANSWSTATELDLGLADTSEILNASVDINTTGTVIALGFKNANSGEGVVQVWRYLTNAWVKDLHLGSPVPAPFLGGFGQAVAIDDTGTVLAVTQLNARVYIFRKASIWSASPSQELAGLGQFGYILSMSGNGSTLVISNPSETKTYVFNYATTYVESQVINYGLNSQLSKDGIALVISNFIASEVKVYLLNTTYVLAKTIVATQQFGFSIAVSNSKDIFVGNPAAKQASLYSFSSDYTLVNTFVTSTNVATDNFGYSVSMSTDSYAVSNYSDRLRIYSNLVSAQDANISIIRQDEASAASSDTLLSANPNILMWEFNTPLTLTTVGSTKSGKGLNGLVLGWLFFNRSLTQQEINTIENTIKLYLGLKEYSLYAI